MFRAKTLITTVDTMQNDKSLPIIPNTFLTKLWHLVNHPEVTAIVWDSKGVSIKVNQELMEKQILSPSTNDLTCCRPFQGITFSSFIRQLYAYGFRKAGHCEEYQAIIHYYFHPYFNKNKPQLLYLVRRSTFKYGRPETESLPEKVDEKVVHSRCDNNEEANMHTGKSD